MATNKEPKDFLEWLGFTSRPDWRIARPFGYVTGVAVVLLFGLALITAFWTLIQTLIAPNNVGLGAGTLVVALLGAPFLIWRTIIAHKTLGFQKEGYITDRISKAVDQLGADKTVRRQRINDSEKKVYEKDTKGELDFAKPVFDEVTVPNLEVRIGGILTLERIAQDSVIYDNGRDHVRIMEIICAYIRQNAPVSEAQKCSLELWKSDGVKSIIDEIVSSTSHERTKRFAGNIHLRPSNEWAQSLSPPRNDIELAIKVLGRRNSSQRDIETRWNGNTEPSSVFNNMSKEIWENAIGVSKMDVVERRMEGRVSGKPGDSRYYSGYRLDLRGVNLQRIDLTDLNFSFALFDGSTFDGATMLSSTLVAASFGSCSMVGAYLGRCNAAAVSFGNSKLECSNFCYAVLVGANFDFCNMPGAFFEVADLHYASFTHTELNSTDFGHAKFKDTFFLNSQMAFSTYEESELRDLRFMSCIFKNANFKDAEFDAVEFSKCDLSGATITQEQVASCKGDPSTVLPNSVTKPETWSNSIDSGLESFEIEL